jgi:hypothetical protein
MRLFFDRRTQRYHDFTKKTFISMVEVKARFADALASQSKSLSFLADRLVAGTISVREWEIQTRYHLKNIRVWSYTINSGGQRNMNPEDYRILGTQGNVQNSLLRGFAQDLRAGKLTEKQLRARLELHVKANSQTADIARTQSHIKAGFTEERRLTTAIESCKECLLYARTGWIQINKLPDIGQKCQCKANCKCYKEYK